MFLRFNVQIQTGTNINLLFSTVLLKTLMLNMDEGDITCLCLYR